MLVITLKILFIHYLFYTKQEKKVHKFLTLQLKVALELFAW